VDSGTWRSGTRRPDLIDEKLDLARQLGAEFTINASKQDPVEEIQALGGGDQAISLAVSPRAFEQAYGTLRRGGKLVFVALPADNQITLPIFETVLNGITIVGSIVGTRSDVREVFELHAAGKTEVIREVRPLDTVNQSIAHVEAGRVAARIVFELWQRRLGGGVERVWFVSLLGCPCRRPTPWLVASRRGLDRVGLAFEPVDFVSSSRLRRSGGRDPAAGQESVTPAWWAMALHTRRVGVPTISSEPTRIDADG
jgi:Zinc-binding dehydrogenase